MRELSPNLASVPVLPIFQQPLVHRPRRIAGRVEAGSGVSVDGADVEDPDGDSSWAAYERLAADSEDG